MSENAHSSTKIRAIRFGALVLSVGLCAAAAYLAYLKRPQTISVPYIVAKMAPEERTITLEVPFEIDGQVVTKRVTRTYFVSSAVTETRTRDVTFNTEYRDLLKFAILVAVATYYGVYSVYVLIRWMINPSDRRFTSRLFPILTFAVGVLTGIIGASDSSAEIELLRQQLQLSLSY